MRAVQIVFQNPDTALNRCHTIKRIIGRSMTKLLRVSAVTNPRCPPKIAEIGETEEPPLLEMEPGHSIRCHIPIEELRRLQKA